MKEINIFINSKDLSKVTNVLHKHHMGITFFEIQGTGRTPRQTPENIQFYQTGRTTIPKYIEKIFVISIVSDALVDTIVKEIMDSFDFKEEPYGVLFVKDVSNAFELGTILKGDEVLVSQ